MSGPLSLPGRKMFICGGDFTPANRSDCPHPLHNWPLAKGYVDASDMAARRLRTGWNNTRCPDCHLYGWTPGKLHEDDTIALPPAPADAERADDYERQ